MAMMGCFMAKKSEEQGAWSREPGNNAEPQCQPTLKLPAPCSMLPASQHVPPFPPVEQYLGLEVDAAGVLHAGAHLAHEGDDVRARGVTAIDDEIAMDRRDFGIPYPLALE